MLWRDPMHVLDRLYPFSDSAVCDWTRSGQCDLRFAHVHFRGRAFTDPRYPWKHDAAHGGLWRLVCILPELDQDFPIQLVVFAAVIPSSNCGFGHLLLSHVSSVCPAEVQKITTTDEGVRRAKDSLKRLRGNEIEADKELVELQQAMEAESEEAPWGTLFSDKSIRKRVVIANMLQWSQQFTGVNAILSYGPAIFIDAGVPIDPLVASVIVNFCMLLATIATMFVIDTWGRRILLLLGGGVMFVSMSVAALLAYLINDITNNPDASQSDLDNKHTYGLLLVVAVCIYAIGFGPWGAIPWVYPSEIFPMDVKEKAMSTSVCSQWAANFLIAYLVVGQVSAWGSWGTLAFYAASCGVVVAYVAVGVPEIKGVRIEDMESIFGPRTTGATGAQERLAEA